MTPLRRIAIIGNSLPRRCGIATFTTDLQRAISTSRPSQKASIVAMTDHGQAYDYPASVAFQVKDGAIEDYVRAAEFLNAGPFDIACLQHEFGIFGGEAGAHILELLSRLTMPIVTTLQSLSTNTLTGVEALSKLRDSITNREAQLQTTLAEHERRHTRLLRIAIIVSAAAVLAAVVMGALTLHHAY